MLTVRLTPKSAADAVEGLEQAQSGPLLKARVRAAPDAGMANQALIKLLAKWMGETQAQFSLAGGGKSRVKRILERDPEKWTPVFRKDHAQTIR